MSNIQKQVSQLEQWLLEIPGNDSGTTSHAPSSDVNLAKLSNAIDKLSEQLSNQQYTLNNIIDRIDILEGLNIMADDNAIDAHRNVPVATNGATELWVDNKCTPLYNEIVGDILDDHETTYTVTKLNNLAESSLKRMDYVQAEGEDKVDEAVEAEAEVDEEAAVEVDEEAVEEEVEVEEEEEVEVDEEAVEVEEEEVEEEEVEAEVEEEEVEEEVEEAAEAEAEAEEEGIELEVVEYKNTKYYRDNEMFIYTIDEDDQPSVNPIGYWKEKTQTIAFYKTK
jgi:hypothetical protein